MRFLWGEIKFWFDRYRTWFLVGIGFLVLTGAFLLISRFSSDTDRKLEQQAQQVEQVQQVVEEQQQELLGDSRFAQEVQSIPTESQLVDFVDSQIEGAVSSYTSEEVNELIEREYGLTVRLLAESGYILSDAMTADQRTMIQLYQEQALYSAGDIEEEDLVSVTIDVYGKGIPKTEYNVSKYLGQRIMVDYYTYSILNLEEKEVPHNTLFTYDSSVGDITMTYNIAETINLGDVNLIGGMVLKGNREMFEDNIAQAYLIFQPTVNMTGEEFTETIENLDIRLNGFESIEIEFNQGDVLRTTNNVLTVQIVDGMFGFRDESGAEEDAFSEMNLEINGETIPLEVSGLDFEANIEG